MKNLFLFLSMFLLSQLIVSCGDDDDDDDNDDTDFGGLVEAELISFSASASGYSYSFDPDDYEVVWLRDESISIVTNDGTGRDRQMILNIPSDDAGAFEITGFSDASGIYVDNVDGRAYNNDPEGQIQITVSNDQGVSGEFNFSGSGATAAAPTDFRTIDVTGGVFELRIIE